MSHHTAVWFIPITAYGKQFPFTVSPRTCITYPTSLPVRWDQSFCAIADFLRWERLLRDINFTTQLLLAMTVSFMVSLFPHFLS